MAANLIRCSTAFVGANEQPLRISHVLAREFSDQLPLICFIDFFKRVLLLEFYCGLFTVIRGQANIVSESENMTAEC